MTGVQALSNSHDGLSIAEVARLAREVYADVPGGIGKKQRLRPYICPFHVLVEYVQPGSTILDVGCGAGLLMFLLARLGRIRGGIGFDTDRAAIWAARGIASALPAASGIRFEHRTAHEAWPEGQYDIVSLIDVMHHVPPDKQANLIATAAAHVGEGGILLYKDMASRPLWRAWANRVHDLLSAREWIHYARLDDVIAWAQNAGLNLEARGAMNMLWYRHEWCVFRRSGASLKS